MKKVIKNVHVFGGNTVSTELAHVVINNGYIQSVGAMAPAMCEEYNARGLTLLPTSSDSVTVALSKWANAPTSFS